MNGATDPRDTFDVGQVGKYCRDNHPGGDPETGGRGTPYRNPKVLNDIGVLLETSSSRRLRDWSVGVVGRARVTGSERKGDSRNYKDCGGTTRVGSGPPRLSSVTLLPQTKGPSWGGLGGVERERSDWEARGR